MDRECEDGGKGRINEGDDDLRAHDRLEAFVE